MCVKRFLDVHIFPIWFVCSPSRCRHIGKGKNNEETDCRKSLQKAPLLSSYENGKKNSRTLAVLTSARTVHNGLFRTADYTSGYKTDPACGTEPGLSLRVRFSSSEAWAVSSSCTYAALLLRTRPSSPPNLSVSSVVALGTGVERKSDCG